MDEELQPRGDDSALTDLASEAAAVGRRAASAQIDGRMPAVYLGHGAPPLVDDELWTAQLAAWASALPRPRSILMVSAHWTAAPLTSGAVSDAAPLIYDFYGFPERYYRTAYPCPGAPLLVDRVRTLLGGSEPMVADPARGLDHGAYVPLVVMYPDAGVPVLQVSMPGLDPARLFAIGEHLRPLRDEGVLIVGSGFLTHGLPFLTDFRTDAPPPAWSSEFDAWAADALGHGDIDALMAFRSVPSARFAHPTAEHLAPLFVTLGAGGAGAVMATPITGYWMGLSKRSVQIA